MQARCQCVVQTNDNSDSLFSGIQTLLSTCLLKPATHPSPPSKLQPWHIQNWSHSSSPPPKVIHLLLSPFLVHNIISHMSPKPYISLLLSTHPGLMSCNNSRLPSKSWHCIPNGARTRPTRTDTSQDQPPWTLSGLLPRPSIPSCWLISWPENLSLTLTRTKGGLMKGWRWEQGYVTSTSTLWNICLVYHIHKWHKANVTSDKARLEALLSMSLTLVPGTGYISRSSQLATKVDPTTRCFKEIKKPLHTSKKSKEPAQRRETQVTCEKITHFCVRA